MDAAGTHKTDEYLDPTQRSQAGTSNNIGEQSVLAAREDVDTKLANVTATEDTPLLVESRSSSGTLGDSVNEWEGLPWYKKPSVSLRYLLVP
jgi:hypothetical protein